MSKLHVVAVVASFALALPASRSSAQAIFGPGMQGVPDRSMQGRVTEGDTYTCSAAPGGSRIRANCDAAEEIANFKLDQQLKLALETPAPLEQCGASTTTEYRQLGAIARVNGTLEIKGCAAASGTVTIAVRVKDGSGEEKPLEFTEPWQRSDAKDVSFTGDYPIGEKTQIVDVLLSGLTCTCTGPTKEEPQPATEN